MFFTKKTKLKVIVMMIIVVATLVNITANGTAFAQESTSTTSKEITITPGAVIWFTIYVPADANNPKLVGSYSTSNGYTIKVNVLKEEGCPTPLSAFDCVSIYSVSNRDHGNFDVSLEHGKTYYLLFTNEANRATS